MSKHVMISYNQVSSSVLAQRLNKTLKDNNLKTWIDLEKMDGNIYGSMADGVDNAFVVLVLVTNEYCNSQNCKDEVANAKRQGKPLIPIRVNAVCDPAKTTGTVGGIVGSLLYENFTNLSKFDENFTRLLTRIRQCENSNGTIPTSPLQTASRKSVDLPELVDLCTSVYNKYDEIKVLIEEKNANVNYKKDIGFYGITNPLIGATWKGHLDIVKLLISNGANVNDTLSDGKTALIMASIVGNLNIAKILIDNGACVNDADKNGYTALHLASSDDNNFEIVKLLVQSGANVNVICKINDGRWTPLMSANMNRERSSRIYHYLKAEGAIDDGGMLMTMGNHCCIS